MEENKLEKELEIWLIKFIEKNEKDVRKCKIKNEEDQETGNRTAKRNK